MLLNSSQNLAIFGLKLMSMFCVSHLVFDRAGAIVDIVAVRQHVQHLSIPRQLDVM